MRKQIVHIEIHQSSKIVALLQALVMFIFFAIPLFVLNLTKGDFGQAFLSLFIIPLFYFAITYVILAVMFYLYNRIAKRFGGIEMDVVDLVKVKDEIVQPVRDDLII
jgi:pilus assembly protein TadC